MRRGLAPALLTVVALVSLTGCMKLDADLEVHEDETVSGSMTVGMSKQAVEMMSSFGEGFGGAFSEGEDGGTDGEEPAEPDLEGFEDEFFDADDVPEGAEVEPYEDDKFIGQTMTFDGISMDELNATSGEEEDTWTLTREGDTFIFAGNADFSEEEGEPDAAEMEGMEEIEAMFAESEMEISVTFPGRVTDSNGEVDGNTVTWRPEFGEALDMRAEADASPSFPVWPVVGGVVGVLLLGGLVLIALRQRRSRETPSPEPLEGRPTEHQPL
jgi:hypothetical protein